MVMSYERHKGEVGQSGDFDKKSAYIIIIAISVSSIPAILNYMNLI